MDNSCQNTHVCAPRNVFFNLSLFQFLTFLRRGIFYTFMINYLYMLMHTVTSTAALGTLNMLASALGQNLLWGRISDRYKLRTRLIVVGETIASFAYIIVFLVHKFSIDMGGTFTAGLIIIFGLSTLEFFWSMSDVGWSALLTDLTTPPKRGRIVGILNFVASLGRMVGIIFAGYLYSGGEGFKNGTIFFIVATLLLIGAAIMTFTARYVKEKPAAQGQNPMIREAKRVHDGGSTNEKTYHWLLLSLIIIVLGASSINQVFLLFIKLPEGLNASDPEMSLILSTWTMGGMLASLASGWLTDKIGRTKTMLLGLFLAIATPIMYSGANDVLVMAFAYGLNGVSFWAIQTVGFTLASDIIPEHKRGLLFSRYNTVMALSWGPAGLLIGGPLADIQTSRLSLSDYVAYVNTFYASAIIVTIGTILFALKFSRFEI
ncbi:MAG: MFS transporter [Candidatus Bathyarchaeales archaeon]